MNPGATNLDGHALAARYETLRQEVMAPGDRRHTVRSLALLMRKGMAAWMRGIKEEASPVVAPVVPADRLPACIERGLINIIAAMALATATAGA